MQSTILAKSIKQIWPKKIIGGWIQLPDMQILFKFQFNGLKIWPHDDLWLFTLKSISFSVETTSTTWWGLLKVGLKIVTCRQLTNKKRHHKEHDACKIYKANLTSTIIGGWIQWPNLNSSNFKSMRWKLRILEIPP